MALAAVGDKRRKTSCLPELPPQAIGWWILAGLVGLAVIGQALARQSIVQSEGYPTLAAPLPSALATLSPRLGSTWRQYSPTRAATSGLRPGPLPA